MTVRRLCRAVLEIEPPRGVRGRARPAGRHPRGRRRRDRGPGRRRTGPARRRPCGPSRVCSRRPAATVRFEGHRIAGRPAHEIVARGLLLVPEGRKLFPSLTVQENLDLGAYLRQAKARRAESLDRVLYALPDSRRAPPPGGRHAVGGRAADAGHRPEPDGAAAAPHARRAVARAGAASSPTASSTSSSGSASEGTPVLLVEQNVRRSLQIARRAYVLEHGAVVLAGPARELRAREDVRRAYLGL